MIGLSHAHRYFETTFATNMGLEFPGTPIFIENQQKSSPEGVIFCETELVNSAADTKPMDQNVGSYKYRVQYEVQFFTPEGISTRDVEEMIERFSVWFNNKSLKLIAQATMETHYTSVSNIGRRDARYIRTAKIPADIYAQVCEM